MGWGGGAGWEGLAAERMPIDWAWHTRVCRNSFAHTPRRAIGLGLVLSWAGLGLVCDDMHMLVCMLFVCMCGMLLVYRAAPGPRQEDGLSLLSAIRFVWFVHVCFCVHVLCVCL